ncbi:class I SAM-dependent DNA methyltransferase [Acidiferrobacter thiooxydans]|uniref:class I SAM-dependent DNA methyltransferase n=1 Tax=Acidiferrobacter thiooxydans TaxID=163359 RepID=UPI000825C06B|nr:DNA methyltransferase [Acidiferrobacter thiooxydans]UEO00421.1 class I SAM-dependent DNA methyltransferase [Acidiferrobacter thiooxydans]
MNAVEIEAAVSDMACLPFDRAEFPFAFLAAFDNKETTISRLRKGETNASDVVGGVLQRNNIHIAVCEPGTVGTMLNTLRVHPKTASAKAKFILATDGQTLEAEDLASGETIACDYPDFAQHFGFFLPLAGISPVQEIKNNPVDVRATGRLNRLYVELLKDNPEWATEVRRHDLNHFMARLIFCFFAEDTRIFDGDELFTRTIEQMTERDGANTHEVLSTLFRAMNTKRAERDGKSLPLWSQAFPYVNGGLFAGSTEAPRFSRMARTYLLHAGHLDWGHINPDIFGSMIQAVADEGERGALGMHYTSVPNILKVLNPLFLDDLRSQLEAAGTNPRMLLNLRKRMAKIRVFDPACGSGNFLVIAYKQMRAIEAEINKRRDEPESLTAIPLTNFRGIELRDFPAEIARLALIVAEYQCDVLYRGQKLALDGFLPLDTQNWITCGNALQLDWLSLCPPTGSAVKVVSPDLFETPLDQAEMDFKNEGGETYICGNPPYLGSTWQSAIQKSDLKAVFESRTRHWKSLDYVAGWFMKAADYATKTDTAAAFVSTNSICQGQQVPILWPLIFAAGSGIDFAYTSFKWANLASHNAGVTVVIVGISPRQKAPRRLFSSGDDGGVIAKEVEHINAYLIAGPNVIIEKASQPIEQLARMDFGNKPVDGGHLLLTSDQVDALELNPEQNARFVRRFYGSAEFIRGLQRYCLWIDEKDVRDALMIPAIANRIEGVRRMRLASAKGATVEIADHPHRFGEVRQRGDEQTIVVPRVSSENREYLPVGLAGPGVIIGDRNFALYDAPLWNMALIASRLHWVWIGTVCVRMRTDFSYSNTLGWNTFPVPQLTDQNKADLTRCAEDILLAREAHFPATIADLYEAGQMPENLRHAHERNDEVLERIYIGRRFRNDTERLEKLFALYAHMTGGQTAPKTTRKSAP